MSEMEVLLAGAYLFAACRPTGWRRALLFAPFAWDLSLMAVLSTGWLIWCLRLLARGFTPARGGIWSGLFLVGALYLADRGRPGLTVAAVGAFCLSAVLLSYLPAGVHVDTSLPSSTDGYAGSPKAV